jgi:hypothetical protein
MRVKHAMNEKLATQRGRTLYERRKAIRLPRPPNVRHRVEADEHHPQPPQTLAALARASQRETVGHGGTPTTPARPAVSQATSVQQPRRGCCIDLPSAVLAFRTWMSS